MKLWIWPQLVLLVALVCLTGCGKPSKPSAAGEVTGYVCVACKAKFYVEAAVVPQFCPQCKATGIQPLVGYLCATDNHLTISTQHSKPLRCEQCGVQTTSLRQPTAAELAAYGAVKKSSAEFKK
jgi:DNA-directed RNA polymerase subunit RPC12/RpoP